MTDENIIPNTEGLTPDEASAEISKIMGAVSQNPKHPYADAHNFQHQKYVEAVSELYKIKNTVVDDYGNVTEPPSPVEKACQEGLEIQAEKQNKLVVEAQAEMKKLAELGFEVAEIPDDIQTYQLRGLQEQRLLAEGNFVELKPMLEKDLGDLRDFETLGILQGFQSTPVFDETMQAEVLDKVVRKIHEINKQKFTKGKK